MTFERIKYAICLILLCVAATPCLAQQDTQESGSAEPRTFLGLVRGIENAFDSLINGAFSKARLILACLPQIIQNFIPGDTGDSELTHISP
jgi:hypothetical protein